MYTIYTYIQKTLSFFFGWKLLKQQPGNFNEKKKHKYNVINQVIELIFKLILNDLTSIIYRCIIFINKKYVELKYNLYNLLSIGKEFEPIYDKNGMLLCKPRIYEEYDFMNVRNELNDTFMYCKYKYDNMLMIDIPRVKLMNANELYHYIVINSSSLYIDNSTITIDCKCTTHEDKYRCIDCHSITLDHDNKTITHIKFKDGHVIEYTNQDNNKWKIALLHASISIFHYIVFHCHNFVHFHFIDAFAISASEKVSKIKEIDLQSHIKYILCTNQNGLGGYVTDYGNNEIHKPIIGNICNAIIFNECVSAKVMSFYSGTATASGLQFGFPFKFNIGNDCYEQIHNINLEQHKNLYPYIRCIIRAYQIIHKYVSGKVENNKHIDAIKLETLQLMKTKCVDAESIENSHFIATFIWLSTFIHSIDHVMSEIMSVNRGIPIYSLETFKNTNIFTIDDNNKLKITNVYNDELIDAHDYESIITNAYDEESISTNIYNNESRIITSNMSHIAIKQPRELSELRKHIIKDVELRNELNQVNIELFEIGKTLGLTEIQINASICY